MQPEGRRDSTALKTASETPAQPTATQEVAKVFVEQAASKKKLDVPAMVEKGLSDMSEQASALLDSLKEESFPWEAPLESPEAVLSKELASVSAGHTMANQEAAEAALQGTKRSIAALDAAEGDPDLEILLKRQERQEKEVARLTGKRPTAKLQKLALEDIQTSFKKRVQTAVEGTERGEAKAKIRATTREETLGGMIAKLQDLQTYMRGAHKELTERHNERAAAKASQAAEVHALIEDKISAIDSKTEPEELDEDMEQKTQAEVERDEAQMRLLQANAKHALTNSKQAADWEHQSEIDEKKAKEQLTDMEGQRDAEKQARAHMEGQRDAEKQARADVEQRLANLEEAFRRSGMREQELAKRASDAEAKAAATVAEATAALAPAPDQQDHTRRRSRSKPGRKRA